MVDIYYKNYLKQLAAGINMFWYGREEEAYDAVVKADLELDSLVGKHISLRLYESLEMWLKHWRDVILHYNNSPVAVMPGLSQYSIKDINLHHDSPLNTSLTSEANDNTARIENGHEKELGKVIEIYKEEKIIESAKLLQQLRQKYDKDFYEEPLVKDIENDYSDVKEILIELQDKNGWTCECDGKVKVSYKKKQGIPVLSFLSEAEVDVSFFNIVALLYETDLYPTWLAF